MICQALSERLTESLTFHYCVSGGPEYTLELDSCDVIRRLWRRRIQGRAWWLNSICGPKFILDRIDKAGFVNIPEVWHSK